jgi:phosphoglucosamine mutase
MNKLFGADGIRGAIGRYPFRVEDVERLGRAVAAWLREISLAPAFLIGTDTRESSQRLKAAFIDGLTRAGIHVVDASVLPTPAVSYLIARKGVFAGGAMVSASHSPVVENGFKFFDQGGTKIRDEEEALIETLFFGSEVLPLQSRRAPTTREPDYARQYAYALAHEYRDREWHQRRIVVDCANGATYRVGPLVLSKLGVPHTLLNVSPDGVNVNRQAGSEFVRMDPQQLATCLRTYDAEVGVAFDGDADRVLLVDRDGHLYDGDMVLAMLALKLHREGNLPEKTLVATQMSNTGLAHYIRQYGLRLHSVRNGDKYVTQALLKHGWALGGEEIGHVILHTDKLHVTGDGLRTALAVLSELIGSPGVTLRDLAPGMRKWPQVKASVGLEHRVVTQSVDIPGLENMLDQTRRAIPDLSHIECRPASTEPVYRIVLEAQATPVSILAEHALRLGQHIQRCLRCPTQGIHILNCVNGGQIVRK